MNTIAFVFWTIGVFTSGMLAQLALLAWLDWRIRRRLELRTEADIVAALTQHAADARSWDAWVAAHPLPDETDDARHDILAPVDTFSADWRRKHGMEVQQ